MGSRGSNGGGRDTSANNVPPSRRKYQPVTGSLADPREKDDTAAKMDLFYERGATKIKEGAKTPSLAVNAAVGILSGPLQAGSRRNREFFTDKVLGSKNFKGTTKSDFQKLSATEQESMFTEYMSGRTSGQTDAYGNQLAGGRNDSAMANRTKSAQQPKTNSQMNAVKPDTTPDGPTSTEVDQQNYNIDVKRRGRKRTVLTSVEGDTSTPKLSKKVLLGG